MPLRRLTYTLAFVVAIAGFFFGLGTYNASLRSARQAVESEQKIEGLRAEVARAFTSMRQGTPAVAPTSGIAGNGHGNANDNGIGNGYTQDPALLQAGGTERAAIVEEVKRQLQHEMGLLPLQLLKDRRESFVELYAYDNTGKSSYGTAGYLGDGYFITVKHGVMALRKDEGNRGEARRIVSIKLIHRGHSVNAHVIDAGDADVEVDPGDWAIIKVDEPIDLPPLQVNAEFPYEFADPIFRLGNDYSKGIILSTGYVGQRTPNGLITCLTDGHPGVSGGGVLNRHGDLVGIPVGRMRGDYRFSFILPIRAEMFRKVPELLTLIAPGR
jgi:hypothetical protein